MNMDVDPDIFILSLQNQCPYIMCKIDDDFM